MMPGSYRVDLSVHFKDRLVPPEDCRFELMEFEIPPIGLVQLVDPATGVTREVRVTRRVQERFADEAAAERQRRRDDIARADAQHLELSTDDDWLVRIVNHVQRRRVQAVRGGVI